MRYYHVSGIAHCSLSFQLLLLLKYHVSNITLFSSLSLLKGNTMATSQLLTDTKKFVEMIVDVIADLRKKHKRVDCKSIHKEIVKIADFSNISKEDLMNRINIPLTDEKILNKRNRNLDSYYVNENKSPDNNKFSETPHNTSPDDAEPIFSVTLQTPLKTRERSVSINRIPDFTVGFASPDGKSSNIDITLHYIMKT